MPCNWQRVFFVDVQWKSHAGEISEIVCMAIKEIGSSAVTIRWQNQVLHEGDAFQFSDDDLLITFNGTDVIRCMLEFGWTLPSCHIDLYAEFRNQTNGLPNASAESGLLSALSYYSLKYGGFRNHVYMNKMIATRASYTDEEKNHIIGYCKDNVLALERLYLTMSPKIHTLHALHRGRYMVSCAEIEYLGIPIDSEKYFQMKDNPDRIRNSLISGLDKNYGVYQEQKFSIEAFSKYLLKERINWPRTRTGQLKLDDDTFKEMALRHPQLADLRQLRKTLVYLRNFELPVAEDSRIRCSLKPFASKTGRNQPSTSQFIFGLPKWLRGLICPPEGYGLAYIDYAQQEFGIAAGLSRDEKMMEAYQSYDPYLAMAKQAGKLPTHASQQETSNVRKLFKMIALATQYSMGPATLAKRLGCTELEARILLEQHRKTYKQFWEWSEKRTSNAYIEGEIIAALGWSMKVGAQTKPTSVQNFPMQANGSEMLRLACIYCHEKGVEICAPVHDALLIEAPLKDLEKTAEITEHCMQRAAEIILDGFKLKTDVQYYRYPERFLSEESRKIWDMVNEIMEP